MKLQLNINAIGFLVLLVNVHAFHHPSSFSSKRTVQPQYADSKSTQPVAQQPLSSSSSSSSSSSHDHVSSRRLLLKQSTAATIFSTLIAGTMMIPSQALAYPQEKTDKDNLVKGYKRLQYLLDNWEKETTICGRSDNPYIGCERTPEKVMEYLGYKSMNDPLFKADKTLLRLQSLVPSDDETDYMEAMEMFNEKAEEASNTAFVSSWGEANPGGGKDRVELFIERSRKQVESARDSLGTVIKILGMQV
jgi:hypothetical protein